MRTRYSPQSTIHNSRYTLILLSLFLIGWIGSWSRLIKDGNKHYEAGEYNAALEAYQSAVVDRPEDTISHYNLGTVLYQNKRFEKAADEFRQSLDAKDPIRRSKGYYNLGNAQVQSGDLEGAIRSYKSALRLNPTDLDAKHNLELAFEKLTQQQSRHQNQSDSEDGESDQQKQSQQNAEENQQNEREQAQNQQNAEKSEPQQQNQQNQKSSEQVAESEESPSQPEQDSAQQPDGISREDAIRLLEAVKDDEKEIQKKILRKRFSRRQRPEKDW